jgi:hypothetical protein
MTIRDKKAEQGGVTEEDWAEINELRKESLALTGKSGEVLVKRQLVRSSHHKEK